ncbi:MAG: fimbrillin family protein [Prevotella sp.]|nr:fimbrillin family protein [Prevotella sp.]
MNFSIYTQRATRAGYGTEITTDVLKNGDFGFGVFGFYSNNDDYSQFLQPNFMYNQQVKWDGSNWTYEPVKYWPNEYGNAAESDDVDKVTFFAYAPWVEVNPSTGVPVGTPATEYEKALLQSKNITSVNKNTAIGDPIIKYVVDTDPKTSVDLLWGVVPMGGQEPSTTNYTDITGSTSLTGGWPYMNLIKEQAASNGKVNFNFMHATAKLNVQIDADVDEATISGGHSKEVDAKTRIYVRSVSFTGFAMKGALNLNNSDVVAGMPNWLDFDSSKELSFDGVTFYDGRKDGKEATKNGAQDNERPAGLNPRITQDENCTSTDGKTWDSQANAGVTHAPVFLWGSWNTNALVDPANADSYIYVIPQQNEPVTVTIVYDVETIDPNLPGYLSDGITHGSTIENTITSSNIFGASVGIESGKSYVIKMHLGMTSVKFDASVVPWANGGATTPVFPANM